MKKLYTLVILLVLLHPGYAQITVTDVDFANPGDTVVMSDAKINQLLSYHTTGPNSTWDFSTLQYNGQHIDTFFKETSASAFYVLYFSDVSFNSHRSNFFTHGDNTAPVLPLLPLTITNNENFFDKNSSHYIEQGFGADINSIPLPIAFSSPDVVYNFPLNFGDADNSASGYSLTIPAEGYYGYQQTRTNTVDGWGTVITPFDTFQAIRVLSEIASDDTFYISTLSTGVKIPRFKQRQYKWITNNQKEPVLQINTQVYVLNIEVISSIVYRDTIHPVVHPVSDIIDPASTGFVFNVFPNPASGSFTVLYQPFNQNFQETSLCITDITGRTVFSKPVTDNIQTIETGNWQRGIYFVTIFNGNERSVRKLVVQ